MKKTYKSPELVDRGPATERTLQGSDPVAEPETMLPDKIGIL